MIRIFLLLLMQMLCAPLLSAAAESPVYPRPQRMEISPTYTTVTEVSVRQRGKKSRGGMWDNLPKVKEGYAISITEGKAIIYVNDDTGLFYAKQTLCQLLKDVDQARDAHKDPFPEASLEEVAQKGQLPLCRIADWPDLPYRGVVEGYYGIPWSTKARLAQLDFYGRNKLNTYIYAPKDDPYHHGSALHLKATQRGAACLGLNQCRALVCVDKDVHIRMRDVKTAP
ncbi:MAG: beta-N-acetylglucosaminidase domain-containing protein [Akkermansia sp.]|nr:beta-N-acetylglucosaminidase domain-containing protein [Akkermansia sp.]